MMSDFWENIFCFNPPLTTDNVAEKNRGESVETKPMNEAALELDDTMNEAFKVEKMDRDNNSSVRVIEIEPVPALACLCSWLFCPLQCAFGYACVSPNEVLVLQHIGHVTGIIDKPGCHPVYICCLDQRRVSTKVTAADLEDIKVVDSQGVPVIVSAVINFAVEDPLRALYAVEDYRQNVESNAQGVLMSVVGTHTYQELRTETAKLNASLLQALQPTMVRSGVRVISMVLNQMNYAQEIQGAMLKKQEAGALLEARHLIVEGAVVIAEDAIRKLEQGGLVRLSNDDKVKIVTNILTVICSDSEATPTVPM